MLTDKQLEATQDRNKLYSGIMYSQNDDISVLIKEVKRLKQRNEKLERQLKHAMHAITAASNGFSNLIERRYPLSDVPIMLNRVRELEILALDHPTLGE